MILSVLRNQVTAESLGVYISVNKPYFALEEVMKSQKIPTQNMYFLDCASGLMVRCHKSLKEPTYSAARRI